MHPLCLRFWPKDRREEQWCEESRSPSHNEGEEVSRRQPESHGLVRCFGHPINTDYFLLSPAKSSGHLNEVTWCKVT